MRANYVSMMAATALLASFGCTPNVEKLRAQQDAKVREDKRAALAEYAALHQKNPKDHVAAYLYARILDEALPREAMADQLIKEHPDFPWGHLLKRSILRDRGDLESAVLQGRKAVELAPDTEACKEAAGEDSKVMVTSAGSHSAVTSAVGIELARGSVSPASVLQNLDVLERAGKLTRAKGPGFEVIATTDEDEGLLFVRMFVMNTSSRGLTIRGGLSSGAGAVCFAEDGSRSTPKEWAFDGTHGKRNCLSCDDVVVPPGEVGVPNVLVPLRGRKLVRCVFHGFPDTTVLVKTAT